MPPPKRSVQQAFLDECPLPITSGDEKTYVAIVNNIKGQALFEVSIPNDNCLSLPNLTIDQNLVIGMLVQLPNKFKNTLWIKRGLDLFNNYRRIRDR